MAIYGQIEECASQLGARPGFNEAFKFVRSILDGTHPALDQLGEIAEGQTIRIDLVGEKGVIAYAQLQHSRTKPRREQQAESHRLYADVQTVVDGDEIMELLPAEGLKVTQPYNPDRDVALYEMPSDGSRLLMRRGFAAVLFPTDVHAPLQAPDGVSRGSRRVVVKVRVG
ncbi:MAG TPA: YhcH/YjgK/YiaL family protein [Pirellulales bacterium]|nr:YhcH/YjgK/YiaL family protein [Pirellulales bacterium]